MRMMFKGSMIPWAQVLILFIGITAGCDVTPSQDGGMLIRFHDKRLDVRIHSTFLLKVYQSGGDTPLHMCAWVDGVLETSDVDTAADGFRCGQLLHHTFSLTVSKQFKLPSHMFLEYFAEELQFRVNCIHQEKDAVAAGSNGGQAVYGAVTWILLVGLFVIWLLT